MRFLENREAALEPKCPSVFKLCLREFTIFSTPFQDGSTFLVRSLNHSDATADASSESILKAAYLIAIFKSKWQ